MKHTIILAAGLLLLSAPAIAQNFEGPNQKERQAWAKELEQREAATMAQVKAAEAEAKAAEVVPAAPVESPVSQAAQPKPGQVAAALPVQTVRQSSGAQATFTTMQPLGSQGGALASTPQSGSSVKASADGQAKAGSAAAEPGNAAKDAEIRERIKAATTNGQGGRR